MRRVMDERGVLAVVDALAFFLLVSMLWLSIPAVEERTSSNGMEWRTLVRGAHAAVLGANTTGLPGGNASICLWRYLEMSRTAGNDGRTSAGMEAAERILSFLLGGAEYEWKVGPDVGMLARGRMDGETYCDTIDTPAGISFSLRVDASGAAP
jgi:hypothetical protein